MAGFVSWSQPGWGKSFAIALLMTAEALFAVAVIASSEPKPPSRDEIPPDSGAAAGQLAASEPLRVPLIPRLVSSSTVPHAGRSTPATERTATASAAGAQAAGPEAGMSLYAQHCADCHGAKGGGDGIAARFLFPKPRDFRSEEFRLVSTDNSVPTTADLVAVLTRGMPGSAMPAWPALTIAQRQLLADYVMKLRRDGIADMVRAQYRELDEEVDEEDVADVVADRTTPGDLVDVPELGDPSPEAVARGRELYLAKGCASCHGKDGKGNTQQKMVDSKQRPVRARDLTLGYFKGQPDAAGVYRRILTGMPGSPMPASLQLTPDQVADLTHFVLSLSDEQTRASTVLNRERIVVRRVATLPAHPTAPGWNDAPAVRLRVTPLWWRNDFEPYLNVQAVHDGTSVALRLSWKDTTPDTHAAASESFEDATAMGLTAGPEPFLGMGSKLSAVDVWMWDADRQRAVDVADLHPNLVVDRYPFEEQVVPTAEFARPGTAAEAVGPVSLPARATGNAIVPDGKNGGSSLQAGGPGSIAFRVPISAHVRAKGQWQDGRWFVVLQRPLTVEPGQGVSLQPGQTASTAFAVWDGTHHDRNGQKLITIWQDLVLER